MKKLLGVMMVIVLFISVYICASPQSALTDRGGVWCHVFFVELGNTWDSNYDFFINRLFDMSGVINDNSQHIVSPPTQLKNLDTAVNMEIFHTRTSQKTNLLIALPWPEGTPVSELAELVPSSIPLPKGYVLDHTSFEIIPHPDGPDSGDRYELTVFVKKEGLPSPTLTASPTPSNVLINGLNVSFDAYNINGNNFFKLRDLAYALNGSQKQFEIDWDAANNRIYLTGNSPYTAVGGEMKPKGTGNVVPSPTSSTVYLDDKLITLTAYNIGGNNYFKLRDIGQSLNFAVEWDGAKNTILIDTGKEYTQN